MKHFAPSQMPAEGLGVLSLFQRIDAAVPAFFRPDRTIHVARAPGRMDVLGGSADAVGSLTLQLPIAEAACVAIQLRDDDLVRLWSPCDDGSRTQMLSMRLSDLGLPGSPIDYDEARALFDCDPGDRWAAHLLGCFLVLARERGLVSSGAELLVHSDVPEGLGVGSSAAVQVAAMRAILVAHGASIAREELAVLCQTVENRVVGVPTGASDTLTAEAAEADELLVLRGPGWRIEDSLLVPPELEFVGLECGVKHGDDGGAWRALRTGAAIGERILAVDHGRASPLATIGIAEFRERWGSLLPMTIGGADYLRRYGAPADSALPIDPTRTWLVREPALLAVEENARAEEFCALLRQEPTPERRERMGDLMFGAHRGQVAAGLSEPVTDFVVDVARKRRATGAPVWGAKVTGRGRGGSVVLLGDRGKVWYEALRIKKALLQHTGHSGHVFRWSSPGALSFGTLELRPTGA